MIESEALKAALGGPDKGININLDMIIDMGMKLARDYHSAMTRNIGVMMAGGMGARDTALALMIGIEVQRSLMRVKDPKMTELMDMIGVAVHSTVEAMHREREAAKAAAAEANKTDG